MRIVLMIIILCASLFPHGNAADNMLVFIGTYTGQKSKGIYAYEFSSRDGSLTPRGLAAELTNPSFLAIHPNKKFLYAVNETSNFQGKRGGAVTAFLIESDTGKLRLINSQSAMGEGPCHITVDPSGNNVLIANYGGGSVAALPIHKDGSLSAASSFIQHAGKGSNPQRQEAPHAHSINVHKNGRYAYAADLGLDRVLIYRFDAKAGKLEPADPPFAKVKDGAGPRHFSIHPRGRHAYVINEMDCTVTAFDLNPRKGSLIEIQTISTLGSESLKQGYSTAEVQVHPSGKFLYGSNRGHDSIVVFAIDSNGKLTHVENESTQGKIPRNFGVDPKGRFLIAANQQSDTLVVFKIDPKTGALEPAGIPVEAPTPVCVKFLEL